MGTELRTAVGEAVRRQMVSDVPLGSFLSGGLDSSAIVAEMAAAAGRVTTYTIGFTAEDLAHDIVPDDVRYARQVGHEFRVDYNEETLAAAASSICCPAWFGIWTSRSATRPAFPPILSAGRHASG